MQFNSIEFLFCFLPAFMTAYAVFPRLLRSTVLVLGSLIYYGLASSGNYWWVALLATITVLAYLAGLTLHKCKSKLLLSFYLVGLVLILTFFKLYQNGRYLPAGMSFYLFQIAAYLIDVYSLRCEADRNVLSFAGQIMMFPKLLSGPLMDPAQLRLGHAEAECNGHRLRDGLHLLVLGLGLKVILANRLGGLWAEAGIVGYDFISVPFAWLSLIAYAMQLYFDFYGYSLMAMGIGKMLGYDLPRNFDSPYASRTVSEFYRRWHMTLGLWFRKYLYIPLGGNRKGQLRTILNLAVVWLFTGLWHSVGGNYLLWAGFLFLLIANERLWLGKLMNRSRVLSHVYVVTVILLSWVPFAVGDWGEMVRFLGRLFALSGETVNSSDVFVYGSSYVYLLASGLILATPLPEKIWKKIQHMFVADLLIFVLFWLVVYYVSTAAQDPFMYFQY